MKFGAVDNPEEIDFTLPKDHPDTSRVLKAHEKSDSLAAYVGCAKWNKKDLKGFYPRGTKDELTYYATQFNSIELNATFYRSPDTKQVLTWKDKTPDNFKFFPKIPNTVSHYKRLIEVQQPVEEFADAISNFEEKLGMAFLQMHDNFQPKNFDRVEEFVQNFPPAIPLAVELRNATWFEEKGAAAQFYALLEQHKRTNVIVDTAGRRDMLDMRLTSPVAFIRYVGANHDSDYKRLDDWVERIKAWQEQGLQSLFFFVHQNIEKASPLLSAYFIEKLNKALNLDLHIPQTAGSSVADQKS